jgi:osmotically-inducible protein OsmY
MDDPRPDVDEPKQYLVERVRDALMHDPRVAEHDVHVRVVGARVFLQGTVPTPERRDAATAVAREVCGEREVFNEMTVVGYDAPAEEEHLA